MQSECAPSPSSRSTLVAVTLQARADDTRFSDGEKAFLKARAMLQKQYVDDKVSDDNMWRAATEGLLHGVGNGKWDKLMSPNELAALKADLVGEVVGPRRADRRRLRGRHRRRARHRAGSGAERAGLMVGDKILRLDGKTLKGMSEGGSGARPCAARRAPR